MNKEFKKILLIIIPIFFLISGINYYFYFYKNDKFNEENIAMVGKLYISEKEFTDLLNQKEKEILKSDYENNTKTDLSELHKYVMFELVKRKKILNLCDDLNISVDSEEINNVIIKNQSFFVNNVFNKELYKKIISSSNFTIKEYEQNIQENIMISKLNNIFKINSNEILTNYYSKFSNLNYKIKYKEINKEDLYKNITDKNILEFYEKNKELFVKDKNLSIKEIIIDKNKIKENIKEEEIYTFYKENETKFISDNKIISLEDSKDKIKEILTNSKLEKITSNYYFKVLGNEEISENEFIKTNIKTITEKDFLNELKISEIDKEIFEPIEINNNKIIYKILNKDTDKTYKNIEEVKDFILSEISNKNIKSIISLYKNNTDFKIIQNENINEIEEKIIKTLNNNNISNLKNILSIGNKKYLVQLFDIEIIENENKNIDNLNKEIEDKLFYSLLFLIDKKYELVFLNK